MKYVIAYLILVIIGLVVVPLLADMIMKYGDIVFIIIEVVMCVIVGICIVWVIRDWREKK